MQMAVEEATSTALRRTPATPGTTTMLSQRDRLLRFSDDFCVSAVNLSNMRASPVRLPTTEEALVRII